MGGESPSAVQTFESPFWCEAIALFLAEKHNVASLFFYVRLSYFLKSLSWLLICLCRILF